AHRRVRRLRRRKDPAVRVARIAGRRLRCRLVAPAGAERLHRRRRRGRRPALRKGRAAAQSEPAARTSRVSTEAPTARRETPIGAARRLASREPALAAIALPVVLLAVLGWARRWAADDAYIDFRVVDNMLHGLGPVFYAGERVEAYTSPLWVAILAAVHGLLDFNLPWTAVAIGLALTVAGLACGAVGA